MVFAWAMINEGDFTSRDDPAYVQWIVKQYKKTLTKFETFYPSFHLCDKNDIEQFYTPRENQKNLLYKLF